FDIGATSITHTGTQAALHLIDGVGQRSLKGHTALYTFGNQLAGIRLEVPIRAALTHSGQAAHTTIHLKLTALIQLVLSGRLLTACHQGADHNHISAGSQCLDDIAGILNTAISNNRDAVLRSCTGSVVNSSNLRHTNTGNNTSGADRT